MSMQKTQCKFTTGDHSILQVLFTEKQQTDSNLVHFDFRAMKKIDYIFESIFAVSDDASRQAHRRIFVEFLSEHFKHHPDLLNK